MLDLFYDKCIFLEIKKKIYIGYSGGMDSSVLLNLCFNIFKFSHYKIRILNINYSHNNSSKNWCNFVKTQSEKYKIPINIFLSYSKEHNKNLEKIYRNIRYTFFFKHIKKNTSLLLAHNFSDLSETILLNVLRGCGINGFTSIKDKVKYKNIDVLRPLLLVKKNDIYNYASANSIEYILDFSNFSYSFNRNFLRYNLYPKMKMYLNNFEKPLVRFYNILSSINIYLINKYRFFLHSLILNKKHFNLKYIIILPKILKYEFIIIFFKANNLRKLSNTLLNSIEKFISLKSKNKYLITNTFIMFKNVKHICLIKTINNSCNIISNKYLFSYKKTYIKTYNVIIENNEYTLLIIGKWNSFFFNKFVKNKFVFKLLI